MMTTKIAIVYEDHTNDRYLIEPLVAAAAKDVGKPSARISSITNPRVTGFSQLLKLLCSVVHRYYNTVDVIIVVFDVDCEDGSKGRSDKVKRVTDALKTCEVDTSSVVVLPAHQEVEVYALWDCRATLGVSWAQVRAECDPKERFFDHLLTPQDQMRADGGRVRLIRESLGPGWNSLKAGCPELVGFQKALHAAFMTS